jgi:hypothetical protein
MKHWRLKMQVKVKSRAEWKNYKNAHLGISLGNPNATGQALQAIIRFINESQFTRCFIDLSDTLHRHNFMHRFGLNEKQALLRARNEGDKWLEQNFKTLEQLNIDWELYRWEHWLGIEQVHTYHERFKELFARNALFQSAVLRDIYSFTARNGTPLSAYLLEEIAVLSYYFKNYPCAKLYPGKEQDCMKMVRLGELPAAPAGLSNSFYTQLWIHMPAKQDKEKSRFMLSAPTNANAPADSSNAVRSA